ncbi:hypothetical protein DM860_009404 [Cuscuta australis]|uniref:Homeobox domain-containing protein n=1 Tax=Cuscuta australis TaxID=267555 RepID=A0A328DAR4_9ASTE|nr:hypothetical protein DM860_009404 [Cuscuta australis]
MGEHDKELDLGLGLGLGRYGPEEDRLPNVGISLDLCLPLHSNDQSGEVIFENSKPYEIDEAECENSYGRKKLRLNKEQSELLEDCFKHHTTLTMDRKLELAKKLNLKPRQVEVWFQNRRARTKLKQTEVDCKLLKKHCESLSYENARLRRELHELRSKHPFPDGLTKTKKTFVTCPSCQKMADPSNGQKIKTELKDLEA